MLNQQPIHLPTDAKRRLRTAAHRNALIFENSESLRYVAELRELVKQKADPEAIERFIVQVEAGEWLG